MYSKPAVVSVGASDGLSEAKPNINLGDSRGALPLPACGERSEFARSSRKFRVRGLLHESELRGKAPSPTTSPPLWRGPLTPTLSPQAGRGSRKTCARP